MPDTTINMKLTEAEIRLIAYGLQEFIIRADTKHARDAAGALWRKMDEHLIELINSPLE